LNFDLAHLFKSDDGKKSKKSTVNVVNDKIKNELMSKMGLDSLEGSVDESPRDANEDALSKENLVRTLSFSIKSLVERTNSIDSRRGPKGPEEGEKDKNVPNLNTFSELMKHLYTSSNTIEKKMQRSIDKEIKALNKKLNAMSITEEINVADGEKEQEDGNPSP